VTLTTRSTSSTFTEDVTTTGIDSLAFTPTNTARFTIDSISVIPLLITMTDAVVRSNDSTFVGDIFWAAGGDNCRALFSNCSLTGVATNQVAPTGGTWYVGDRTDNLTPIAGGTEGWLCVTGGSPGIWRARGVIAP